MTEFTGRLSKAPVVYALCQIRFSPVLKMADYVSAIQDQLRERYPRFNAQVLNTIQIAGPAHSVAPAVVNRWIFNDKASCSGFILEPAALVFHTTAYADFSEFLSMTLMGLSAVQGIAKISLVERVGLRYIDLIVPLENAPLERYVQPALVGLSLHDLGMATETVQQFVSARTDAGKLFIKFSKGLHGESVPSDLLPLSLAMNRKPPQGAVSGILDTDHFTEEAFDFEIPRLESVIRQLKGPISQVFRAAITEYAVKQWT